MTSNSKVFTASAKDVLSPGLYAEVERELGERCEKGCRLYFKATKGKHIWRGDRLKQEDIKEIIRRKEEGNEAVIVIAESYKKSPSYIHRLIAKHREDKGNGQPNQEPAIQEVSSAES